MASFSSYRNPNSNRSNNTQDDASKDLKANIRESRLIQPEQWESPEVQEKFNKVKHFIFEIIYKMLVLFQGTIDFSEVYGMLQQLGIKVQRFELNKILEKHDRNKDGHMNKEEFEEVRKTTYFYL